MTPGGCGNQDWAKQVLMSVKAGRFPCGYFSRRGGARLVAKMRETEQCHPVCGRAYFICRGWQSVSKKGRTMAKSVIYLLMAVVLSAALGCATPPKSGKGFTLPAGDPQAGKENYVKFYCNACHKIDGIDQSSADGAAPELSIALGGEVTRIETYGELVTSIINPSHRQ